jgi:hypothetical protein
MSCIKVTLSMRARNAPVNCCEIKLFAVHSTLVHLLVVRFAFRAENIVLLFFIICIIMFLLCLLSGYMNYFCLYWAVRKREMYML